MGYPVKFGKYLLLERVNVGGMAEVFKAKTFGVAGFERILAIKRILPTLVEDDEFVRMFIDEARIAVQLNHANIAQIYELGKHGEHFYIAMEYLSSKDLRAILDNLRINGQLMPIPQAAYVISKVCEGLDYAHRRRDPSGDAMGIIHRDVSPQNVLISYEGEVKIIDFGIAKAANRASKTQAGVLKGKFGYMSPEQVRGLPIDRRSDIFAVGVLLYEMLTGERLFIGESDFSTLERVRNAEVAPPTTFNKKITPELEAIVLRALAREVEDRYQWSSELAEDLQRFLIEDRSIYSAKRLAAYMKETYNTDIASERSKMEEYLKLDQMDAVSSPKVSPPPPPPVSAEGTPAGDEATAMRPNPTAEGTADFDYDDNDADGEFEGEDKTFVIEASDAGLVLQNEASDENKLQFDASATGAPAAGRIDANDAINRRPNPDVTNDDFLSDPSLYGEDDYEDDDDDAKTQVSFDNPFAEDVEPSAPSAPRLPSAANADSAPLLIHEESMEGPPLPEQHEVVPGLAPAGSPPLDPVQAAMQEAITEYSSVSDVAPGIGQANGLQPPPQPDLPGPTGADIPLPQEAGPPQTEAPVVKVPKPPKERKGMGAGLVLLLVFGFFVMMGMVGTTAWVAYSRLVVSGGAPAVAKEIKLEPSGDVPSELVVRFNGEQVATALPATVPLSGDAPYKIEVSAAGHQSFSIALAQPVSKLFVSLPKEAAGKKAAVVAKKDPEPKPVAEDPKVEDPPEEKAPESTVASKDPAETKPDDANPTAAPEASEKKETAPEESAPAESVAVVRPGNLLEEHWRISFAAVATTSNVPVQGAEVFFQGKIIGSTPFEAEFPNATDAVELEVRAPGFLAKKLSIAREGRDVVGPGTVRLAPPGSEAPADGEKTADASDKGPTDVAAAEGDVVASGDESGAAGAKPADETAEADTAKPDDPAKEEPEAAAEKKPETKVASNSSSKSKSSSKSTSSKSKSSKSSKSSHKSGSSKSSKSSKSKSSKTASSKTKAKKELSALKLGSQPYAEVWVDAKKLPGTTPMMGRNALHLTPGQHWITFRSQDGRKFRYKVQLGANSASNKLIVNLGSSIKPSGNVKATLVK